MSSTFQTPEERIKFLHKALSKNSLNMESLKEERKEIQDVIVRAEYYLQKKYDEAQDARARETNLEKGRLDQYEERC